MINVLAKSRRLAASVIFTVIRQLAFKSLHSQMVQARLFSVLICTK